MRQRANLLVLRFPERWWLSCCSSTIAPEYICRFPWTEGALAFWDNRAVQHYAASDYYPHRRVLRRVTISGSRPYYAPEEAPAVPPLL